MLLLAKWHNSLNNSLNMKESGQEKLTRRVPGLAVQLGRLGTGIDVANAYSDAREVIAKSHHNLASQHRDLARDNEDILGELTEEIVASDSLNELEKAALVAAVHSINIRRISEGAVASSVYYDFLQKEFLAIHGSLKHIDRTLSQPGQPIFYCEILGGTSYLGEFGRVRLPSVTNIFEAQTDGSGLEIVNSTSQGRWDGRVKFGLSEPSRESIHNFRGWLFQEDSNWRIEALQASALIGSPTYARRVLKRSMTSMQTQPLVIGESACSFTKEFLRQEVPTYLPDLKH